MDMSECPTSTPDRHLASGYLIADGHAADRSQGTIFYLDPTTYWDKYSYSIAVYVKPGPGVIKVR